MNTPTIKLPVTYRIGTYDGFTGKVTFFGSYIAVRRADA